MRFWNSFSLDAFRFQSLLIYKIILLILTIYIWFTYDLSLPSYIYILGFISYLLYYIVGHRTVSKYSHIADLLLIVLFLFGKHLNSFGLALYLLLPVVCRGTFTNKQNNDQYFFFEYISALFILCVFPDFDGWKGLVHLIVPVALIMFVNYFYTRRWDVDELDASLLDLIDDYYAGDRESYHVYRKALEMLNNRRFNVVNIGCFLSDSNYNKLHLVNSSSLVFRFKYGIDKDSKRRLSRYGYAKNISFSLDNREYPNNYVFAVPLSTQSTSYPMMLFVLVLENKPDVFIESHTEGLNRFFSRMSKVILFERELRIRRTEEIQNLQQKSRFVNASINTMHFIKNRLTPFQTLLDFLNNEGNVQSLPGYPVLFSKVMTSCEREMRDILSRAAYLLEKGNNPFKYQVLTDTDSRNIYTLLRLIWTDTFAEDFDCLTSTEGKTICVQVNIEGLDVLFSDIIGNMQKYSLKTRTCMFDVKDEELIITFFNDFDMKMQRDIESLVRYMNGDETDEVQFRITHGTPLIKQNCSDQNIGILASVVENDAFNLLYKLQLTIKALGYD